MTSVFGEFCTGICKKKKKQFDTTPPDFTSGPKSERQRRIRTRETVHSNNRVRPLVPPAASAAKCDGGGIDGDAAVLSL